MRYALLVHDNPAAYATMTEAEGAALTAEYRAVNNDPRVVDGAQLAPPASSTTVRLEDGQRLVTDGPFADTKDVFGGYYVVVADDLDGALEVAATIPAARLGGAIEIRPVVEQHAMEHAS